MTEVLKLGDEIAPWQILANTSFLFGGSVVRVVQPPDPSKSSVQCPCRRLDLASSARMRRTMCSAVRFAVATRLRDQSGEASAGTVVVERTCAVHSAGLIDYHMTFLQSPAMVRNYTVISPTRWDMASHLFNGDMVS